MTRAILNIGRQDVDKHGLTPLAPRLTIVGASSDHRIVDATAAASTMQVGDDVVFALNSSALLAVMTSPYVAKRPLPGGC
jgi:predicted amino acid racemase